METSLAEFVVGVIGYWWMLVPGALLESERVIALFGDKADAWAKKTFTDERKRQWRKPLWIGGGLFAIILAYHDVRLERDAYKASANRAVVVGQPGIVYNVNGTNAITAYLRLENYGRAIAGQANWEVGVSVLDIEAGAGSFVDLGEPQLREGPVPIPPSGHVIRHPEAQWPENADERAKMVAAIKARQKGIFVFGSIAYKVLDETWGSGFCRIYAGHNTYIYKRIVYHTASILFEAYPDQEYVPCPNPDLNYGPRKISEP